MRYIGNKTMELTQFELDSLTPWHRHGPLAEGDCFRSVSTAGGSPMVVEIVYHPLSGLEPHWFHARVVSGQRELAAA